MKYTKNNGGWYFARTDQGIKLLPKQPSRISYLSQNVTFSALVHQPGKGFHKKLKPEEMFVVRNVRVNRIQTPLAMIKALHRRGSIDGGMLETMPKDGEECVDVFFFPIQCFLCRPDIAKEFESRGLMSDPYAQIQANIDKSNLSQRFPNIVHWSNPGCFCHVSIIQRFNDRLIQVGYVGNGLRSGWWLAGVLNPTTTKLK